MGYNWCSPGCAGVPLLACEAEGIRLQVDQFSLSDATMSIETLRVTLSGLPCCRENASAF